MSRERRPWLRGGCRVRRSGGHGEDGEVGWVGVGDFVPVEWGGDAGVGKRADGVGAGGGAVFGVLVVVEEDAVTFFLPPFGAGEGGSAAFDGACEGEGGAADFGEGPARVDADVDVHAAGAAGLGPAGEAVLFEDGFDFEGYGADVGPFDAGAGVEVDAELVGMVLLQRRPRGRGVGGTRCSRD